MKIVGIDTNILLTLRLKREPEFKEVKKLLENCLEGKIQILLPHTTLLETEWVLRSYYKQSKDLITEFFQTLLSLDNLVMKDKDGAKFALSLYQLHSQVNFSDCVIMEEAKHFPADELLTFDESLKRVYNKILP